MDSHNEEILERVKRDVRSVLITESGGMLLEDFMKIYRQLTNSTIPYRRLGYCSAEELLLAATDVCRCQRLASGQLHLRPVCDKSTSHVLKMVERSRKPRSGAGCRVAAACRRRGQRVPWLPGVQPDELQRERTAAAAPAHHTRGSVPVEARDSILKLLAGHPRGIHLDEFNEKHKEMFGHAITYIGLGFFSIKGMLESIQHLVRLKETPTGDKAFPMPAPGGGRSFGRVAETGAAGDQPPANAFLSYEDSVRGLTESLLRVLSAQKSAVKVSDVLNLYLRQFGHSLEYQEYGFTSLLGALASLGPPVHLEKRADDWHVSVRKSGGGPPTDAQSSAEEWSAAEDSGPPALVGLAAAAPARFSVQRLCWLEHGRQVTTDTGYPLLEVVITHVRSPGEFFFCLSGSVCELWRMEAALSAVYGGAADRRPPADWQLTVGRPLAALAPAGWRRALLLGRVAEHVKVYLVDTGATVLLPLEAVRALHQQFMDLPALAHEGSLARVAPRHDIWPRPAHRLFADLVGGDVPLMATVLLQSQFVSTVLLCDTRGETDVHVGDQLVSAQHAVVQQEQDWPPAPLRTPASRLLHDLYALLDCRRPPPPDQQSASESESESAVPLQTAAQQGRVPPEGAEPLSPASQSTPENSHRETKDLDDRVAALKVQCYDTQKQCRTAPAGPRRAALHAKLRRLETQLEHLLLGPSPAATSQSP